MLECFTKRQRLIKIGVAPTRRATWAHKPFNLPEAIRYKEMIVNRLHQFNLEDVEFVFLDGITEDGLLFQLSDAEKVAQVFIDSGVDGVFVPHCNFGSEESVARLCKRVGKPVLLWGPKDYIIQTILDSSEAFASEINRCVALEEAALLAKKTVVCYTDRELLCSKNDTKEDALLMSNQISVGVQQLIFKLTVKPSYIVAKGGITSSDIATKVLKIKVANVLGQIIPGVPVWNTPPDCIFDNIPYVIFPGNVGNDDSLREVVQKLARIVSQ